MLTCKLAHWKARRSGPGLSLIGTDTATGKERRITDIRLIETREGRLIATGPAAEVTLKV